MTLDPSSLHPAGMAAVLAAAFMLGLVHGITPDEHTWPITLSYALGGFSSRRGLQAGLLFSAAFTVQRALASELAFLALVPLLASHAFHAATDALVGVVMALSGAYILRRGRELHFTDGLERWLHRLLCRIPGCEWDRPGRPVPLPLTLVHGFIAGWGTGAFAITVYTVLAPATGSAALAFLPGLVFGLGTMATQAAVGGAVGAWMQARRLGEAALAETARTVAGNSLLYGGLLFAIWGLAALLLPGRVEWIERGVPTGIAVPNLDRINAGLGLVAAVFLVAAVSFVRAVRRAARRPGQPAGPEAGRELASALGPMAASFACPAPSSRQGGEQQMAFAEWMAGGAGRTLRVLAGLILIGIGIYVQGIWGVVIAVVGGVPVLAGVFDVCLIAPVLGAPLRGRRLA